MILKQFKTPGLPHFSYLIGAGKEAAVIDPQIDLEQYLQLAQDEGLVIRHIFETHRNEDFVTGAKKLSDVTGAKVWHGPNPDGPIEYAETADEGTEVDIGSLKLKVLKTPGHTDDSISIAIFDTEYSEGAVGVFTGDALFIGDVGRTDFYEGQEKEKAGLLYDSLQKLMGLGDQAILYPAHGAGSVCGSGMAAREFSTIGHERANNPRLQLSRDEFVKAKASEHHYQPPYFRLMEELNLHGGHECDAPASIPVLGLAQLCETKPDVVLDVRDPTSHLGGHISGSVCLPIGMIAAFGGWFLNEKTKIGLVAESADQARDAVRHLCRIGFTNIVGAVTGVLGMASGGADTDFIATVDTGSVASRVRQSSDNWVLLDVRSIDEFESGHIQGALHAYVGEILKDPERFVTPEGVTVMCGSGARASLAASALKAAGQKGLDVYVGSIGAWRSAGKPVVC
ncbi:rhodanese-like domain-containing protein [Ponticaulis sp.]|uniref:MBL fold metallo-hydrolase n=1 Tax=Ponticaulis sp. TaxID=2020902 RepID=UPI000B63AD4A|nr:rhodanese-like domain-containing protein [Ponticaulis sp.]MAI90211.1 MBL fold metallo-hydrolase [Ponticaulis sp.]OUX99858.1 MAG: MBL fold metallo-hydrolase [Hyphomonadaceae bacterium TMED5]